MVSSVVNIFPFLPPYFMLEDYSSVRSAPEGLPGACRGLPGQLVEKEESVFTSCHHAGPLGAKYGRLHCAAAKRVLGLPASPVDCVHGCVCTSDGHTCEVGSWPVVPEPSFLKSFPCPQQGPPF